MEDRQMLSKVKINNEITIEKYGNVPTDNESRRTVVVECTQCHRLIEREWRNRDRLHSCPIVSGNTKRCFKCKTWKDLSEFNKNSKLSGGVAKMCRKCYNSHDAVIKCEINRRNRKKAAFTTNVESYLKQRAYSLKNHASTHGLPFDLDANYLIELWNKQGGKCHYSGIDMKSEGKVCGFQSWQAPSLDRKNPSLGYVKGNVVWCCFGVNSFKQSMTDKEFLKLVNTITWKTL